MYFKDIIDIKVSDNVTNVNAWAFYLCDKTKTISIGKNVSSLNLDWQMTKIKANLTAFNIDEANKNYKAEGNGIYIKNSEGKSEELIGIFGNVEEFHIPEGVKTIGVNAFNAANIATIIIPNTLKTIKNHAFSHSTISEIRIPNSVNTIGVGAFEYCNKLNTIEIDNTKGSITGAPWSVPIGERAIIWLR